MIHICTFDGSPDSVWIKSNDMDIDVDILIDGIKRGERVIEQVRSYRYSRFNPVRELDLKICGPLR